MASRVLGDTAVAIARAIGAKKTRFVRDEFLVLWAFVPTSEQTRSREQRRHGFTSAAETDGMSTH